MSDPTPQVHNRRLIAKFDLKLHEVIDYAFWIGVVGGAGGLWLGVAQPKTLRDALPAALGVVGVIIGAVIAGVAVIAAFLDTVFLRKIRLIKQRAERYVTPFAFIAALGVLAALALLVSSALPTSAPEWIRVLFGCLSGFFTVWTLTSVLPLLSLLIEFVGLKSDAADVPDSVVEDKENVRRLPGDAARGNAG